MDGGQDGHVKRALPGGVGCATGLLDLAAFLLGLPWAYSCWTLLVFPFLPVEKESRTGLAPLIPWVAAFLLAFVLSLMVFGAVWLANNIRDTHGALRAGNPPERRKSFPSSVLVPVLFLTALYPGFVLMAGSLLLIFGKDSWENFATRTMVWAFPGTLAYFAAQALVKPRPSS